MGVATISPAATEGQSETKSPRLSTAVKAIAIIGAILVVAILIWTAVVSSGTPDPVASHRSPITATLDIAVLVFREGLESILVLSALTAGLSRKEGNYQRPIGWGVVGGMIASLITWFIAVGAIDALTDNFRALDIQAATGLLAIVVLLVVMNWFFHRIYWTGWISMHNKRKRELLSDSPDADGPSRSVRRVFLGLAALGFTSFYREGFEVVLFLQSYRLQLGGRVVLGGVVIGSALAAIVAVLTFIARRKLPYKTMLIVTGVLLGAVLLVMVGEQVQEMQLAHWIPETIIPALENRIPGWVGLWFSVFPNVENMIAQGLAAALVIGSYVVARWRVVREARAATAAA